MGHKAPSFQAQWGGNSADVDWVGGCGAACYSWMPVTPNQSSQIPPEKEKLLFLTETKQEMYLLNLYEAASQYF